MSVFQELITRLSMDSSGYHRGAEEVKRDSAEATKSVDELVKHVKEAGEKLSEKLGLKELFSPITDLATGPGLLEFGKHAVEVAMDFDKLERHIAGVVGSAKRAKEVMEFGEKDSGRFGLASPEQLDEVAAHLEDLKLKTEDYLPLVEAMAARSGEGASAMMKYADSLAEARDKGQSMPALAASIRREDGPALALDQDSSWAQSRKFANSADSAYRQVGDAINGALLPAEKALGEAIDKLVSNGSLQKFVLDFERLLGLDPSHIEGTLKHMVAELEAAANWVLRLPGYLSALWDKFSGFASFAINNLELIGSIWAGIWAASKLQGTIEFLTAIKDQIWLMKAGVVELDIAEAVSDALMGNLPAIAAGVAVAGAAYLALKGILDKVTDSATNLNDAMDKTQNSAESDADRKVDAANKAALKGMHKRMEELVQDIQAKQEQVEKEAAGNPVPLSHDWDKLQKDRQDVTNLQKYLADVRKAYKEEKEKQDAAKKARVPEDSTKPPADAATVTTPILQQIAQNTAAMVHDLRRYALGGGDLGRIGVSAVDMTTRQSGRAGGGAHGQLVSAIGNYVTEEVARQMSSWMRSGLAS